MTNRAAFKGVGNGASNGVGNAFKGAFKGFGNGASKGVGNAFKGVGMGLAMV